MTRPDTTSSDDAELRKQITCITGECPAGHDGCIYIDYRNYDAFRTPKTDKIMARLKQQTDAARQEVEEIDFLQIRLDLLEELMDNDCEQVEVTEPSGSKRIFSAVSASRLESKRREMIPRHNELVDQLTQATQAGKEDDE